MMSSGRKNWERDFLPCRMATWKIRGNPHHFPDIQENALGTTKMKIADITTDLLCDEFDVIAAELQLKDANVLELGCGKAEKTCRIARSCQVATVVAMEVDAIQHDRNVQTNDLHNVIFRQGAAEAIPASDASFDIVMMFKSLHHVPTGKMDIALDEIRRVLKPGGLAWISEPVYAGPFNEVIRLFHDEKEVRAAAFSALQRAVSDGRLQLVHQRFFSVVSHFRDFDHFEEQVIQVTHTNHRLSPELHHVVRERFEAHMTPTGAHFHSPLRVDILRRPT